MCALPLAVCDVPALILCRPKLNSTTLIRTTKRLVKGGQTVLSRFDTDEECEHAVNALMSGRNMTNCRTFMRADKGHSNRLELIAGSFFNEQICVVVANREALKY